MRFGTVEQAVADIKAGKLILVADDEDRENEGDVICAAQLVTPERINFMIKKAGGWICLALTGERADQLRLPQQSEQNTEEQRTAFTVSIDAAPRFGVTTGVSAQDRAKTIQVAVDPATVPADLRRPGHIPPLRGRDGGVLQRVGHTEAAIDLARLAGLYPAAVVCEVLNEDGTTARRPQLEVFAQDHGLTFITVAQLVAYRLQSERLVHRVAEARLPTEFGVWRVIGYRNDVDTHEHVALVFGDPGPEDSVLVRMHSRCLTGDVFHSLRCDCGWQLHTAMRMIADEGRGVIVYLDQEGRGIGLLNKLRLMSYRTPGRTRSRRTSSSASSPIFATMALALRFFSTSACARFARSRTIRESSWDSRVTASLLRSAWPSYLPQPRKTRTTWTRSAISWAICSSPDG